MRVLLIEDDAILGKAVREQVAALHSVDWVTRLDAAREHLQSAAYDLILLDLMLPDGLGIAFLKKLRAVNGGVKTGHGAEQKSATAAPA